MENQLSSAGYLFKIDDVKSGFESWRRSLSWLAPSKRDGKSRQHVTPMNQSGGSRGWLARYISSPSSLFPYRNSTLGHGQRSITSKYKEIKKYKKNAKINAKKQLPNHPH